MDFEDLELNTLKLNQVIDVCKNWCELPALLLVTCPHLLERLAFIKDNDLCKAKMVCLEESFLNGCCLS